MRWALMVTVILVFACCSIPAVTLGSSPSEVPQDAPHASHGVIPTHAGLQLTVRANCANVRVFTDALDSVSYALRLEPSVTGADSDSSQDFPLTPRKTSRGVMLT